MTNSNKSSPPYFPVRQDDDGTSYQGDVLDIACEEMSRRRSLDSTVPWRQLSWSVAEVFTAEAVGTAMLVFFGCTGLVNWNPEKPVDSMQGAIVFAVVVATIIQIFGHISAAHLNPAVTIAFTVLGRVSPGMALIYIFSECIGAILGYGLLILLTPVEVLARNGGSLCCTTPDTGLSDLQAVAMEFCATCFLIMVVCACEDPRNADKSDSTPLKFGCVILALSIAVGPYTGASLNPARTLGPAVWTNTWDSYWVYWLGPCLSGFATALFYQAIFNRPAQAADERRLVDLNLAKAPSRRDHREREEAHA